MKYTYYLVMNLDIEIWQAFIIHNKYQTSLTALFVKEILYFPKGQ